MLFDPLYLLIVGPFFILSIVAQSRVRSTFRKHSRIVSRSGLSGRDVAAEILRRESIAGVEIKENRGFLSDHYNPAGKTLNLSPDVYGGRSVSSLGVAAHEVGHAIQHARGYAPLKLRSAFVPAAQIGSKLWIPLFIVGMIFGASNLITLAIVFFAAVVVFQLVTLPVEFDASRRALATLEGGGVLAPDEMGGARAVLRAAALTYVAAAAQSVATLVYFLLRFSGGGGRR